MVATKKQLAPKQREHLLATLQARFEKNMARHGGLDWAKVKARLEARPGKLWSLNEMERTGGEPDVIGQDKDAYIFVDCSAQAPEGRVSLCYDDEALKSRKEHKPKGSAVGMVAAMCIELLAKKNISRCKNWASLTQKDRAGSRRHPRSENSAGHFGVVAAMVASSLAPTAPNLTTGPGRSVAR